MSRDTMLQKLADRVIEHQDGAAELALDEDHGLERLRGATESPRGAPRHVALALASAAVILGCLLFWLRPFDGGTEPLAFEATVHSTVALGQWVERPEPTTLSFSDGTRLVVQGDSRARVAEVDAQGATIELARGALDAEVEPREGARWRLRAGPYLVRVTGTAFVMRWDPEASKLAITMREGSVHVTGPELDRKLLAPHRLEVSPLAAPTAAQVPSSPAASAPEASPESLPASPEPIASPDTKPEPEAGSSAAEDREADDAAALMRRAQQARLEGDGATSTRLLAELRQRFPDSLEARTAIFLAGKGHHDAGRHQQAVGELQAYLAAAPKGAFAREALVMQILSLHALGDPRADPLARAYLAKHGEDVHAARVRRALVAPP